MRDFLASNPHTFRAGLSATHPYTSRCLALALSLSLSLSLSALPALAQSTQTTKTIAKPAITASRSQTTPLSPYEILKQANLHNAKGDLGQAEAQYRAALSQNPDDYLIMVKLADVLTQTGKPNEAISLYQKALIKTSQDPMIHLSLGALFEQQGQYDKALASYQRVLANNPAYHYAHYLIANAASHQNQLALAKTHLNSFLADYPDHYDARKSLAQVSLLNNETATAIEQYGLLKVRFPERFNESLNFARALLKAGDANKALDELKEAYSKEGAKADILEELGNAHKVLGQWSYAIQNYQKALELDPSREALLLTLADLYQKTKKTPQVISTLEQFIAKHPEHLNANRHLAIAYVQNKQYDKAIKRYTQALQNTTSDSDRYSLEKDLAFAYQAKGDLLQAIPRYEALLKKQDPNKPDEQLLANLALAYHKENRLEDAVNIYKQLYNFSPEYRADNTPLRNDLTNALLVLGDKSYSAKQYDDALVYYGDALRFTSQTDFHPHLGIGNTYFQLGMPDKAQEAYQHVLALDANNTDAKFALAKLDLQNQNLAQAIPVLKKLAEDNPDNLEIQLSLGDALTALGDPNQAVQVYEKAAAQLAKDPSPLNQETQEKLLIAIGNLYQTLGQSAGNFEKAKLNYDKALTINPNNAITHFNLGIVYNELNQLAQSTEAYQEALKIDPGYQDARYGLAVSLEKQRKFEEALETYQLYMLPAGLSAPTPNQSGLNNSTEKEPTRKAAYLKQAQERISYLKSVLSAKPVSKPAAKPASKTPSKATAKPEEKKLQSQKPPLPNQKIAPAKKPAAKA